MNYGVLRSPLLCDAIGHHARSSPNGIAFVCGDDRLSWSELDRRTAQVANGLAAIGMVKGDKACLYMGNTTEAFICLWGILRGGYVLVSLNIQIEGEALAQMINNSDARVLMTGAALAPKVAAVKDMLDALDFGVLNIDESSPFVSASVDMPKIEMSPEDVATILYSSGTTGLPKGIEHSHSARLAFAYGFGGAIEIGGRHVVSVVTTPLYTNGTWLTMAPTVMRGGCIVLTSKFSAEDFMAAVARNRGTHAFMVPTQFQAILGSPAFGHYDLGSLRVLVAAGQMLPASAHDKISRLLPHVRVYQAYGMTEGFGTVVGPEDYALGKRGSAGKSFYNDDITVLDDGGSEVAAGTSGEIAAWGGGMMNGYYNDPKRTEDALWRGPNGRVLLRSGDLGYLDEDGFLHVAGRKKDMIKSGGINIFATDIEAVFQEHPDVAEAAAIAVPHEKWVETPLLVVILKDGAVVSEEALRAWGNAKLAKYQRVSRIEFRRDMPRAAYGKVNKAKMREPYWAALQD